VAPARTAALRVTALAAFPDVRPGDELVRLIVDGVAASAIAVADGDVFVVAQKIVSKAENRYVDLDAVVPSERAIALSQATGKDARLVEVILGDARRIVRAVRDVLIVEHRLGFVMANGGVDQSNVGERGAARALRLPADPDASAQRLRDALQAHFRVRLGVVVNDSFGRPWRLGTVGVAIGVAGLPAIVDLRGAPDRYGRRLRATVIGYADEIAAAASLVMGQAAEGQPVAVVQGLGWDASASTAAAIVRAPDEDLFR